LMGVIFLAATAIVVGAFWSNARLREAATRQAELAEQAHTKQAEAEQEHQQSEMNFRRARAAVDRMLTRVAQELSQLPQVEEQRRAILEDALGFYKEFLTERGTDARVRSETARAYMRVAQVCEMLGRSQEAENAWQEAIRLLTHLAREFPDQAGYQEDLADSQAGLAFRLLWLPRGQDLADARRQDLAIRQRLAEAYPGNVSYRRRLAICETDLGNALKLSGHWQEAELHLQRALTIWADIVKTSPSTPADRFGLAHAHLWLGAYFYQSGVRLKEAAEHIEKAVRLREQLIRDYQAGRLRNLPTNSTGLYLADLPSHFVPNLVEFQAQLAHALQYLAHVKDESCKPREADRAYVRCSALYEDVVKSAPGLVEYQRRLGNACYEHGDFLRSQGRNAEAIAALLRAVEVRAKLVAGHPGDVPHPLDLSRAYLGLGTCYRQAGRMADAAAALRHGVQITEKLPTADPTARQQAWFVLAQIKQELALVLWASGNPREAAKTLSSALHLLEQSVARWPAFVGVRGCLVDTLANACAVRFRDPERAVRHGMKLVKLAPRNEWSWRLLGAAHYRAGQWNLAQQALERCRAIRPALDHESCVTLFILAMTHYRLDHTAECHRCFQPAVGWMDGHSPKDPELLALRREAVELWSGRKNAP
ncbi:MAG TPA: tetratricopeptide repeat protein, partial [Gemmataceae bacterium]|nr:tetratricopeptide repeat protein [Gemmataceae bacterium]